MADLQNIANVSISLNSSGVSRAGFGTPIFLTAHNNSESSDDADNTGPARVSSYSNADDVGSVYGTDSNAYAGAVSLFSNDPSVDTFKIGRIAAGSVVTVDTDEDDNIVAGTTYSIKVRTTWDDYDSETDNNNVTATYTSDASDTPTDVSSNLVADINAVIGNSGSPALTVVATDNGGNFTLQTNTGTYAGDEFILSGAENLTVSALNNTNRETLLEAYTAIIDVDNDFYAVTTEVHKDTDVGGTSGDGSAKAEILDLADTIEASDSYKIYFVGSQASESITDDYEEGSDPTSDNDILAWLTDGQYYRSIGWWHDDADTDFNELTFAGYNLPFDSGSVVWGNIQVPMSNAKNSDGNALTTSQEQKLSDRNANWPSIKGGTVYTREGKVASGEWIDIIRGRDNLKSDLEADLFDTLTNQQGQKIPYTDKGINVISGVVETRLNDYKVNRNFLTDPIKITVPKSADISRDVKITRVLEDMSFTATLAGAIMLVDLKGTLEV